MKLLNQNNMKKKVIIETLPLEMWRDFIELIVKQELLEELLQETKNRPKKDSSPYSHMFNAGIKDVRAVLVKKLNEVNKLIKNNGKTK